MKKRVADIIVETLVSRGVEYNFSVVGGYSMHLNNAFAINDNIKTVYMHHEQACSMAAESYARACGKIASVCVTAGPGGVNAINGVQGAWVDSIPMIIISGFPRYKITKQDLGLNIRCRAEQENNIISQVKGITKYSKQITNPYEAIDEIIKAIDISLSGRRGPVWLDIPLDVQGQRIEEEDFFRNYKKEDFADIKKLDEEIVYLEKEIKNASRPCILTGSGIRSGNSIEGFRKFIDRVQIPIVGGSQIADVCYNGQDRYYGMSGMSGPRAGNFILQNSDLIIILGNSLSYKQTGYEQEQFAPNSKKIMVDAEKDEGKKPGLNITYVIGSDLNTFFKRSCELIHKITCAKEWFDYCNKVYKQFPKNEALEKYGDLDGNLEVPGLLWWVKLYEYGKKDMVVSLGNNSVVEGVLREGVNTNEQRVIVNYNSGSMGHDIPNAIGTYFAMQREVILCTGDGSVMLNIQELQTIKHNNIPVKVVIFNNEGYGALRKTWNKFFNGVYAGCDENSGISFPRFEGIAKAFEFPYKRCNCIDELDESIEWIMHEESYCILEVVQKKDDISGPSLCSKMNENGEFFTPPIYDLTPCLSEDELSELLLNN